MKKIYSSIIKDYVSIVCIILVTSACIMGIASIFNKDSDTSPVKGNVNIDSIAKVSDSIKIQVNKLDSIKDAKVIEVLSLDNDSTIKLFYKLVSEESF